MLGKNDQNLVLIHSQNEVFLLIICSRGWYRIIRNGPFRMDQKLISISSISSTKVDQELYLFFYFKLGRLHVNVCRNISASWVISLKSLKLDVMRNFRILISRLFVGLSFFDAKLVSGPFYIFLVCISVYT